MELLMRAVFALALAACTPDIAPATYFCGPEQLCPEELFCNPADNICTTEANVEAFNCGENVFDKVGDDAPATATPVSDVQCVSSVQLKSCLLEGDPGDWFQLDVPDNCNGVQIEVQVAFPIAFEPIAMQLSIDDGMPVPVESECGGGGVSAGQDQRCFQQVVENGSHLAVGFLHAGVANCDGTCTQNRYTAALQLSSP
jgi:hypothetical protein